MFISNIFFVSFICLIFLIVWYSSIVISNGQYEVISFDISSNTYKWLSQWISVFVVVVFLIFVILNKCSLSTSNHLDALYICVCIVSFTGFCKYQHRQNGQYHKALVPFVSAVRCTFEL